MKLLHSIPGVLVLLILSAGAHAQTKSEYPRTMYVTYDRAPLYDSASYMSNVVGELRVGDSVVVTGSIARYFQVRVGEKEGFVLWSNLSVTKKGGKPERTSGTESKSSASAPDVQANTGAKDTTVTPSRRSSTTETKTATRAQCAATTKAGKQCSRTAEDGSAYCWQHRKK